MDMQASTGTSTGIISMLRQKTGYGFPLLTIIQGLLTGAAPPTTTGGGSGSGGAGLTASATDSPTTGTVPLSVDFSSVVSGGTPPYLYSWQFGDGTSSSDSTASHTYQNGGTYNPTLTVTDSSGNTTGAISLTPVTAAGAPVSKELVTVNVQAVQGTTAVAGADVFVNGTLVGTTGGTGTLAVPLYSGQAYTITVQKTEIVSSTSARVYKGTVTYTPTTEAIQTLKIGMVYLGTVVT